MTSIPWGHALNSCASLRARWDAVAPRGLFVEADLRIRPSSLAKRAGASTASSGSPSSASVSSTTASAEPFGIDDVCMAHDAGVEGDSFLDWWLTLESLVASPSSSDADAPTFDAAPARRRPLGLKLDFKSLDAVAPVLTYLRSLVDAMPSASAFELSFVRSRAPCLFLLGWVGDRTATWMMLTFLHRLLCCSFAFGRILCCALGLVPPSAAAPAPIAAASSIRLSCPRFFCSPLVVPPLSLFLSFL